jgi:hypothetical protein
MSDNINQMHLDLPHDVVLLPSEGKFYKNKKKSVKVGYLTAADENILASVGNLSGDQIITNLVRSKLYEPDIRPEEMMEGDLEAILVFLRNTSFGANYDFTLIDPETDKKFEHTITLESLDFKKTETEPNSEGLISLVLPKTKKEIKIKFLTYGESQSISRQIDAYPKGMVSPSVTLKLTKQIIEVEGNREESAIADFISKMPIMDSKYINNFIKENEPRLDLMREITAPSGKKVITRVTFGAEFFRPFF